MSRPVFNKMTPQVKHTTTIQTLQTYCATLQSELTAEVDGPNAFFRGIPFASVSQRWTQSRIQNSLSSKFDATKFGAKCPQPSHTSLIEVNAKAPPVNSDEFTCLNLNITVPTTALYGKRISQENPAPPPGLPVMVWVHGYVTPQARFPRAPHLPF